MDNFSSYSTEYFLLIFIFIDFLTINKWKKKTVFYDRFFHIATSHCYRRPFNFTCLSRPISLRMNINTLKKKKCTNSLSDTEESRAQCLSPLAEGRVACVFCTRLATLVAANFYKPLVYRLDNCTKINNVNVMRLYFLFV